MTVGQTTTPRPRAASSSRVPVERLQRALARAGFGSRRACEDLIRAARVTVGDRVATLGDRVDPARDQVAVDGHVISIDPDLRYFALHKPTGVTVTSRDPHAVRDVTALLPGGSRVFPVGRLDRDTEGLLLVTNDGDLAHRLMHPRYGIEKEYLAEVDGLPTERRLGRLRRGVELEDGPARALAARSVARTGARGAVRLVVGEGRKREVRRMLAALGLPVRRLIRVRVGPVRLGALRAGAVRELTAEEIRALYRAAGL
jgi:23S rRNA pseudouridine2605 synthase